MHDVGGLCVHVCMSMQFSTTSLSSCSTREGNRKRLLVLCDCVSAVLLGVAGRVCVYAELWYVCVLLGTPSQTPPPGT